MNESKRTYHFQGQQFTYAAGQTVEIAISGAWMDAKILRLDPLSMTAQVNYGAMPFPLTYKIQFNKMPKRRFRNWIYFVSAGALRDVREKIESIAIEGAQ